MIRSVLPGAAILLLLAACSGGGGGGSGGGEPVPAPQSSLALFAGAAPDGSGNVDGTGDAARFNTPMGIGADGAGNLYVGDSQNFRIRKITPQGVVTTFAGSSMGFADGSGLAARFGSTAALAVDRTGNVYVADSMNQRIRMVAPTGEVTTLAGSGEYGNADGIGAAATLAYPYAIAVDDGGNVYFAGEGKLLRRISPQGMVTTVAGAAGERAIRDGKGPLARFANINGLATDGGGNVYITDEFNVRMMTPDGVVATLAGQPGVSGSSDGSGSFASFGGPVGIASDHAGSFYIADLHNYTVRKMTAAGFVTPFVGSPGSPGNSDGAGVIARFQGPIGVAVGPSGILYVTDEALHAVRAVTPSGVVGPFAGSRNLFLGGGFMDGTGPEARFSAASDIAFDGAANILVADAGNLAVRKVSPSAQVSTLARGFQSLGGIAADDAGNAYIGEPRICTRSVYGPLLGSRCVEYVGGSIRFVAAAGQASEVSVQSSPDGTDTAMPSVVALARDGSGNLYIGDSESHAIRKLTPAGILTTLAGVAGSAGTADGVGSAARFGSVSHIAVDAAGNLFVSDSQNHTIRKVTAAGQVTTLAGTPGTAGSDDGTGGGARFFMPRGIALDPAGNLYVADTGNNLVRKITPSGVVSTVAGTRGRQGFVPGALPGALSSPYGVAVRGSDLYIAMWTGIAVVRNRP